MTNERPILSHMKSNGVCPSRPFFDHPKVQEAARRRRIATVNRQKQVIVRLIVSKGLRRTRQTREYFVGMDLGRIVAPVSES